MFLLLLSFSVLINATTITQFSASGVSVINTYDTQRGNGLEVLADFYYDYDNQIEKIVYYFGNGQSLYDIKDFDEVNLPLWEFCCSLQTTFANLLGSGVSTRFALQNVFLCSTERSS